MTTFYPSTNAMSFTQATYGSRLMLSLLLSLFTVAAISAQCAFDRGQSATTVAEDYDNNQGPYVTSEPIFSPAIAAIADVTGNGIIEICFWGDLNAGNETVDVTISGQTFSIGDAGFTPSITNPICQNFTIPAAALETDLMGDGDIDISYMPTAGAGWTVDAATSSPDDFNARVNRVRFDFDLMISLNSPADQCQDGTDAAYVGMPADGVAPGDAARYRISPVTAAFNTTTGVLDVSAAAPNAYTVTYEYDFNGCTFSSAGDAIVITRTPRAALQNAEIACGPAGQVIELAGAMFNGANDAGGTWTVTGGGTLNGSSFTPPAGGGCFEVTYLVPPGTCSNAPYSSTANLLVTPRPNPTFTFTGPATPTCSTGDPVSVTITNTSNGPNPTLTINGAAATFGVNSLAAPAAGNTNTYNICMTETRNSVACTGIVDPQSCMAERCMTYTVYNDGNCGVGLAFPSECEPDVDAIDVCEVDINNNLSLSCSFFTINGPQLVDAELTAVTGLVQCSTEEVSFDWEGNFSGILGDAVGAGPPIRSLNTATEIICAVITFEICIPLPIVDDICIDPVPLGEFEDYCDQTVGQVVVDLLGRALGGDGGGGIVVADTDGDGSFDKIVDVNNDDSGIYDFGQSGTASVLNNVQGPNGTITIRNVAGWPFRPIGTCGDASGESINLLELLPIGAIPLVGVIIEDLLAAASCNAELVFTDAETIEIPVINRTPPEFANCNESGYIFSEDGICDTEANWSIPVAYDGCYGSPLAYKGRTSGTDASAYNGTAPATVDVAVEGSGVYQTGGPIPGSDLAPGTYTVTYTAYSCSAVESTCEFDIVVTVGDPVLDCPNNLVVRTDVDECQAVVTGLTPISGISCATIINYDVAFPASSGLPNVTTVTPYDLDSLGTVNDASGLTFPLGISTITYRMLVDLDNNGFINGPLENQTCTFTVEVTDAQRPVSECVDVDVQLDNTGNVTVFAANTANEAFVDGGSFDNCTENLTLEIAKVDNIFGASVNFDCTETGFQLVTLRTTDEANNTSSCLAQVKVDDFFEGIDFDLDIPELCLEANNPEQLDFSNYLIITLPDGTALNHNQVESNNFLGDAVGGFGISAFLPSTGSSLDPGSISTDGVYTPGTGTGFVTVTYALVLPGADPNAPMPGCIELVNSTFELRQPLEMDAPECECIVQNDRLVNLGEITGGLEPYTIQYGGVKFDFDNDSIPDEQDGEFTFEGIIIGSSGIPLNVDLTDFTQNLGNLLVDYTQPTWFFTIVDARGCELFRSGSCDNDDENGAPEILCENLGPVQLFTEERLCEREYAWAHPLPTDNCDVILYTYTITNPDGTISGPFDITALLNPDITNPLPDQFNGLYEFQHISSTMTVSTVTYYAEDAVGNFSTCSFEVTVLDNVNPFFLNCPEPAVIVDAIEDQCVSFANYSLPLAGDNCSVPVVTQVDMTGLVSGDLYPVGITINTFEAEDESGNTLRCDVKVIVNDIFLPPSFDCPSSLTQTADAGDCGAVVNDIAPSGIMDNCIDNVTVIYTITDENGDEIASGFDDASGTFFDVGTSTVQYGAQDQPLLLITEITHDIGNTVDGTDPIPAYAAGIPTSEDYLEITNFNRAVMDVSCLMVDRYTAGGVESVAVPTFTLLQPGESVVIHFGNGTNSLADNFVNVPGAEDLGPNEPAAYVISLSRSVLDVAVINGFDLTGLPGAAQWSGTVSALNGAGIIRTTVWDTNSADDFVAGEACNPTTIGSLNPQLAQPTPNGAQTAIQAQPIVRVECAPFTVTITDDEDPVCGLYSAYTDYTAGPVTIDFGACVQTTVINVPEAYNVADVNLSLAGNVGDLGNLTVTLISPEGTEIDLIEAICAGVSNVDFTLDGDATTDVTASCGDLNSGAILIPVGDIEAFNGELVTGDWIVQVGQNGQESMDAAVFTSIVLSISGRNPYTQGDEVLENDPGVCGAQFSWFQSVLFDNCAGGGVLEELVFEDGMILRSTQIGVLAENTETTFFFPVGTTTVRYTLTDAAGNVGICDFEVLVEDTEDPVLTCPADVTLQLESGECDIVYIPTDFTAEDNCAVTEIFSVPDFNLPLPIGVTSVDFTIRDAAGNDTTCTYVVTVLENIPMPPVMACITNINVHLGPDCEQEIIPEMVLTGNDFFCFDTYTITLFEEDANGVRTQLPGNVVGTDQVGQLVTYQVDEDRSGAPCWGYIDVGFFNAPEFICPADTLVSCNAFTDTARLGTPVLLSCALAGASVAYADTLQRNERCDDPRAILRRTWLVTDNFGNSASCVQTITIEAFDLSIVRFPADLDDVTLPSLNCVQVANDESLTDPTNTGFPFVEDGSNIFGNSFCSASYLYSDEVFNICEGSFEIVRTWKVRNTCMPVVAGVNPIESVQIIRVLDNNGLAFDCPADETISTGPFDCNGAYVIPTLDITPGCSDASYIVTVSGGVLTQLPDGTYVLSALEIGSYTIQYEVEDECGNFNSCQYNLTVNDQVDATAICEDGLNISLNTNGVATLSAEDVDGGSDDLCGNVLLDIRRQYTLDPLTCDPVTPYFSDWGPMVDLNCCDLTDLVTVELRVTDEDGNSSICWTEVLIEDKLAPVCAPPPAMRVTCLDLLDELPQDLEAAFSADTVGISALLDDLFGRAVGIDNCGETILTQTVVDGRTSCGAGNIFRRFFVEDERGLEAELPCTQTIEVLAVQDYTIEFPGDRSSDNCVEPDFGAPIFTDLGCGLLTTNTSIDTFEATADECYKLRITYEIFNWCEYNTEDDAYIIPRDADGDNNLEESTFLHVYASAGVDVGVLDRDGNRSNTNFIRFLDFQDEGNPGFPASLLGIQEGTSATNGYNGDPSRGYFRYQQYVKVYDDVAPTVVTDGSETEFCDEDGDCVETAVLTFTVSDLCSPDAISATVTLDENIDAGPDGIYTLADFVATRNVSNTTVGTAGATASDPTEFTTTLADLPFGTHAIRIVATDGCGNTSVELIVFEINDCKAPTPICINGLTATLMPNGQGGGMAAIWAIDFIASPSTDCSGEVKFAIYRSAFAAAQDEDWSPSFEDTGLELNCEDQGMLAVRIYAIDPAGQFDYCETTILVQAFQPTVCEGGTVGSIAGLVTSANTDAMTDVVVNITDAAQLDANTTTNTGFYQFAGLEIGNDYTVQPNYNPAPNLANISTGDLVMITRHILGIQPLASVYQLEASDVTRDGNTNVVDIIAIRRLILGLATSFPATPSWQFYVANDEENMAQVQNINNLTGNVSGIDFVGVEMGNVSDATPGVQGMPEGRSSLELTTPNLELEAGNTYEVVVSATGLTGFQGTLQLASGLEVTGLEFAEGASAMANLDEVANGLVAMSYIADQATDRSETAEVVTLTVRATVNGQLSDFLSLGDRITPAQGYTDTETTTLGLDFKVAVFAKEFSLEQNTPNPFSAGTTIGFLLPETGLATLKFQNIQGQTILVREIEANAGYNTVNFTKADFKGSTGVMTYTLTVGEFTATRKMILQ